MTIVVICLWPHVFTTCCSPISFFPLRPQTPSYFILPFQIFSTLLFQYLSSSHWQDHKRILSPFHWLPDPWLISIAPRGHPKSKTFLKIRYVSWVRVPDNNIFILDPSSPMHSSLILSQGFILHSRVYLAHLYLLMGSLDAFWIMFALTILFILKC